MNIEIPIPQWFTKDLLKLLSEKPKKDSVLDRLLKMGEDYNGR